MRIRCLDEWDAVLASTLAIDAKSILSVLVAVHPGQVGRGVHFNAFQRFSMLSNALSMLLNASSMLLNAFQL